MNPRAPDMKTFEATGLRASVSYGSAGAETDSRRGSVEGPLVVAGPAALRGHDDRDDHTQYQAQQHHPDADVQRLGVDQPVGDQRADLVSLVLL